MGQLSYSDGPMRWTGGLGYGTASLRQMGRLGWGRRKGKKRMLVDVRVGEGFVS